MDLIRIKVFKTRFSGKGEIHNLLSQFYFESTNAKIKLNKTKMFLWIHYKWNKTHENHSNLFLLDLTFSIEYIT